LSIFQTGDTIRLECQFNTFQSEGGNPIDPESVSIVLYDAYYNVLEEYSVDASMRLDIGKYYYYLTLPEDPQKLYYGWKCIIGGKPSVKRKSIETKFVV
jgi:hypothetical protein